MAPRKKKNRRRQRRKFAPEYKAEVVQLCQQEGESISTEAAVVLARHLHRNLSPDTSWLPEAQTGQHAPVPKVRA